MNMTKENYPHPAAYCKAWRQVLEAQGQAIEFKVDWCTTKTPEQARQWFLDALHRRINTRGGIDKPRGKKDNSDYVRASYQDQQDIRDKVLRRIRVYQFRTPECRRRFANLLSDRWED